MENENNVAKTRVYYVNGRKLGEYGGYENNSILVVFRM